jgi:hypothetical protein
MYLLSDFGEQNEVVVISHLFTASARQSAIPTRTSAADSGSLNLRDFLCKIM